MEEQGKIPFFTAVLMNINVIVGVGIYFTPQMMVQHAGAFSFLGWVAAGLLLLPIVWTVATAARFFPGSGGFYNYGASGLSKVAGFVALWSYMLGFLATAATQLMFLKQLMVVNGGFASVAAMPVLANLLLVLTIASLNLFDVRLISKIQGFATILKLLPMICAILLFVFYWNGSLVYQSSHLAGVGSILPMALFGYWGFESCTSTSHLIKGGSSKASGVMLTAFFVSMSLYALFHFAVTHIMGVDAIASFGAVGFTKYLGIANPQIASIVAVGVVFALMLALFNAVYGVSLGNGANMFSLASKNHLLGSKLLTKVNGVDRPYAVIFAQALIVFLLMTFVAKELVLLALSNFGLILAMFVTVLAVLKTQIKRGVGCLNQAVSYIALAASGVLVYYTWFMIGADTTARLVNAMPFVVGIVAGLGMFYFKKCMSHD
jgi:amino acid transporter